MTEVQLREGLYGFEMRDIDRRRVDPEERKTFNIKQLWQRNHEIINLHVQGLRNTQIAEIMGVTKESVSQTINSELGKYKISDLRKSRDDEVRVAQEKVRVLTNKALNVYHEIFDDESGESSLKDKKAVADTVVLELSGLRAPTKIQSHSMSVQLTRADLEEFKQRGLSAAQEAGLTIDVEPEDSVIVDECTNQTPEKT
jgi:predicted transcriptional regulator